MEGQKEIDFKQFSDKPNEIVLQALLAEYKANYDHILSRDQMMRQIERYAITLLAAAFGSLNFIIDKKQFILLPIISTLITSIASAHRSQRNLARRLNWYQYNKLRPTLLNLIMSTNNSKAIPENILSLWSWQKHKEKYRENESFIGSLLRKIAFPGLTPLMLISSAFFLFLFIKETNLCNLDIANFIIFIFACLYLSWFFIVLIRYSYWITLKFGPHDFMN